jgi:hypothetical protein
VAERNALRKMVLLRWCACAVDTGSASGGAAGGARFGALRVGEGRVPIRDYVRRGKVSVAWERLRWGWQGGGWAPEG